MKYNVRIYVLHKGETMKQKKTETKTKKRRSRKINQERVKEKITALENKQIENQIEQINTCFQNTKYNPVYEHIKHVYKMSNFDEMQVREFKNKLVLYKICSGQIFDKLIAQCNAEIRANEPEPEPINQAREPEIIQEINEEPEQVEILQNPSE